MAFFLFFFFVHTLQVLSVDETASVGRVSKQWTGYIQEAFTDADNFGIKFPLDLDVKIKAVLLGACFLIVSFYMADHASSE